MTPSLRLLAASSDAVSAAEWVSVVLTGVLVGTTIVYAFLTKRMADRMDGQLRQMKQQQDHAERARLREKSDRGAYACLSAVEELLVECAGRPLAAVPPQAFRRAKLGLEHSAPLVHDKQVRDYVSVAREILFVASFDEEQVQREEINVGTARMVAGHLTRQLAVVLHAYLSEEEIPPTVWQRDGSDGFGDQYPTPSNAGTWIRRIAHKQD